VSFAITAPDITTRKGITTLTSIPIQLTLSEAPSRENPAAGGSVRHLLRSDVPVLDADGKNLGTASAITILVRPNNGEDVDTLLKLALQTNISFFVQEVDGSLDAAAAVDSAALTRFINGEG
jgi:hypothetical protein